jgi:tetratricopeptide (TPR) repeat protein
MIEDHRGGALQIAEPATPLLLQEDGGGTDSLLAALGRLRSVLDRERAEAPDLASELLALAPERREERLRRDLRFRTWGLCELLLEKSLAAADPAEAASLAALTLAGTDRLDPARHAVPVVEDLKARAWAAAGEARRRQGDLAAAEEALRAAAACLAHGTGDLLVEARLLEFEAAVRRQQGRGGEAAALLKLAAGRYRESGETELLERVLAARAEVLREHAVK